MQSALFLPRICIPFDSLRRIFCNGRNCSQPYFFKRNQSSDNRSHGFGAKFLLKKLSASDFSYERKSAFSNFFLEETDNISTMYLPDGTFEEQENFSCKETFPYFYFLARESN